MTVPAATNWVEGSAVAGPVVQAGTIHGGVYLHSGPARPVPRQLPLPPAHFTDRSDVLDAMDAATREAAHTAVIALSGTAGSGTTGTALQWLHRTRTDYPGGSFYCDLRDLRGVSDVRPVLRGWLRAVGVTDAPPVLPELVASWRTVTADLRTAVLLDHLADPRLAPLLLPAGPSVTVVTARRRMPDLARCGAALLDVGPLPAGAAVDLLAAFAGRQRVDVDPEAAREIAETCGGLPLALAVVGATLASRPARSLAQTAAALRRPRNLLPEESFAMPVHDALAASYDDLPATAQRAYRLLAAMPVVDVDPMAAGAVLEVHADIAAATLDVLADAHLLTQVPTGDDRPPRFAFGDLPRQHAVELCMREDGAVVRHRAVVRLLRWMVATSLRAQLLLTPSQAELAHSYPTPTGRFDVEELADRDASLAWQVSQQHNVLPLLEAVAHLMDVETNRMVWRLVDTLWGLFQWRHPYELWHEAHDIGLAAARRTGDAAAVRQMLTSGAIGLADAREFDRAVEWYTRAGDAARAAGAIRDAGQALHGIAGCHLGLGELDQAEAACGEAGRLWEECRYPRGTALVQALLAQIHEERGNYETALDLLRASEQGMREVDDDFNAHRARALHGRVLTHSGRLDDGIAELHEAAGYFRTTGATRWEGKSLAALAAAHADTDPAAARDYATRALELYSAFAPREKAELQQWAARR